MTVVAFLDPPQDDVIEKIRRHRGLWQSSAPRAPPAGDGWVHGPDGEPDIPPAASDEPREPTFVDAAMCWATFGPSPTVVGREGGVRPRRNPPSICRPIGWEVPLRPPNTVCKAGWG
jgi:hypothetical protein